ncbi:MAG: Holliday junction resolvase RuvX [Alphaproteobacteria bacterium]|nr:Holliday junction resolvase RuvX [Alphaproteobacteria bacterium]MCB9795965.1 Holliday junction resolvase RuvX [Alphaproteobacteria bacterium]
MQAKRRAIALDVGTKTIGIAVSDPLGLFAQPHSTLARQGVKKDCARLQALCEELEVAVLVVGLPLELDDTESRPARLARQIGEHLGELVGLTPIYVDERYSSVEAERYLLEMDLSRAKRKQVIDQAAAVVILQSWLEHGEGMVV